MGALGCVVLGASVLNWAQAPHARDRFTWVPVNASQAPAIETAEVWQVSGSCVRPYFARALLRSEAKLKAYYAFAPEAVRARLNATSLPQSPEQARWYHLVTRVPESSRRDAPDREYVAQLHVQYAEWYANVFKLELDEHQWQQRFANIADQRLMLSESARRSFAAYSSRDGRLAGTKADFDDYVLSTLGLGGFPSYEEQALRADCVKISLVKKISQNADSLKEFWHWPVEQAAGFAFGLELILIGIFLVPITLWIGTGDLQIAARHIRSQASRLAASAAAWFSAAGRQAAHYIHDAASRLAAKVSVWIASVDWQAIGDRIYSVASRLAAEIQNFNMDQFSAETLERLQTIRQGTRAFVGSLGQWMPSPAGGWPIRASAAAAASEAARRERLVSLGSLAAALFADLWSDDDGRHGAAWGTPWRTTWPRRPSPKSRRPW